jgi:hypothetical protein
MCRMPELLDLRYGKRSAADACKAISKAGVPDFFS